MTLRQSPQVMAGVVPTNVRNFGARDFFWRASLLRRSGHATSFGGLRCYAANDVVDDARSPQRVAGKVIVARITQGAVHMQITTIGLDIAKNVFQVHGIDAEEKVVARKQLRRGQVLRFFEEPTKFIVAPANCFNPVRSGCRWPQ